MSRVVFYLQQSSQLLPAFGIFSKRQPALIYYGSYADLTRKPQIILTSQHQCYVQKCKFARQPLLMLE